MSVTACDVLAPERLEEALQLLAEIGGAVGVMAGGTDVLASLSGRHALPRWILDLARIPDLARIDLGPETLVVGSTVTAARLATSTAVAAGCPALALAARSFASPAVRQQATIGGNVMSAAPDATLAVALVAAGARAVLASGESWRQVPLHSFFMGRRHTATGRHELLIELRVPRAGVEARDFFRALGARAAAARPIVVLAARADAEAARPITLAAGGVAVAPIRLHETERLIQENGLADPAIELAVKTLDSEITPTDDARSTAACRRLLVGGLLREALRELRARL